MSYVYVILLCVNFTSKRRSTQSEYQTLVNGVHAYIFRGKCIDVCSLRRNAVTTGWIGK